MCASIAIRTSGVARTVRPNNVAAARPLLRCFSNLACRSNTAELKKVLLSEIEAAEEEPNELEPVYLSFLKESGFEVKTMEGSTKVEFYKRCTKNDEIIRVFFDAQEIADAPAKPEEDLEDEGDVDEDIEGLDNALSSAFVVVEKPAANTALLFHLYLNDDLFFIDCVQPKQDAAAFLKANEGDHPNFSDSYTYEGPSFLDLDESLQVSFEKYLHERGITEKLATTLLMYSQYKEELEYRNWLKRVAEQV